MKNFYDRFYPGTAVLINKLDIQNYDELESAEKKIVSGQMLSVDKVKGKHDLTHLKEYHKHLFGKLYEWAGNIREFNVRKEEPILDGESVAYTNKDLITSYVDFDLLEFNKKDFSKMNEEQKLESFRETMVNVWEAHPFDEGNTRTTTVFMVDLAKTKGLDLKLTEGFFSKKRAWRDALVQSTAGINTPIRNIIKDMYDLANNNKSIKNNQSQME